jgi:hypothetical protein
MGLTSDLTWRKAVDQIVAGDYESAAQLKAEETQKQSQESGEKANFAKSGKENDRHNDRNKENNRRHDRNRNNRDRDQRPREWCSYHNSSSHSEQDCRSLKRRREQRDRNATCPFCDKDGHTVDDCEEKKRYKQHKKISR